MSNDKTFIQALGLLSLLVVAGCKPINVQITVTKLPDQTGGKYSISGTGFSGNESVRLEIQNAPPKQPDTWQLGTASATNGSFSFQTEDFRCAYVADPQTREKLKNQEVRFVATGVTSHYSASAAATANQILICP
jgi:hypothetical protein